MGLEEELTRAQNQHRAQIQSLEEAAIAKEEIRLEAERKKLEAKEKAILEANEQKAALRSKLEKLLEVSGAREQLVVAKKVWQAGKIDTAPEEISDIGWVFNHSFGIDWIFKHMSKAKLSGLALALRYKYTDIEDYGETIHGDPSAGELSDASPWVRMGTTVYETEVSLHAIVGITEDKALFVTAVYGEHRLDGVVYRKDSASPTRYSTTRPTINDYLDLSIWPHTGYINKNEWPNRILGIISPDDTELSRQVLGRQLVAIFREISNPLDKENRAKEKIADDDYLPKNLKDQFAINPDFSVFKPIVPQAPSVRELPWYRKLFF